MSGRPAGGGGTTSSRNSTHAPSFNDSKRMVDQNSNVRPARMAGTARPADRWEHFRESKLEKMRAHKASVERRLRTGDNLDNRTYWSQRNDKLKRYARHESLDPSWYTDNIYSNQSIDLDEADENEEDDDFFVRNEKFDRYFERNAAEYSAHAANDNAAFERARGHLSHTDGMLNYPKSRSCCFGGGYIERPKPQLMPKSSSFSVASRSGRHSGMPMDMIENNHKNHINNNSNNNNNSSVGRHRKLYCWQNRDRDYDKYGEVKEIYHIDRDRDIYKQSKNDIVMEQQQAGNANCIRNIWRRRAQYKNTNFHEINGNQADESYDAFAKYRMEHAFDACHFVEEYLIVPDPMRTRLSEPHIGDHADFYASSGKRHNSLDRQLLNDPVDDLHEDNSNLLFEDMPLQPPRTKNMLEVRPPKRFDDTSSDSTDLDLDDFNFDFEKYWSELDYCNNNVDVAGVKDKNVNVDRFNNNRLNRENNIHDDSDSTANFASDFKRNIFDMLPSPTHTARPARFAANSDTHADDNRNYGHFRRPRLSSGGGSITGDLNKLSPIDDEPAVLPPLYHHPPEAGKRTPVNNQDTAIKANGSRKKNHNHALSLINNIFSIYKPKKYSPVNCRPRTKADVITKGMNVPSTVRPLGGAYNEFMTSEKRPLTITPPRYTGSGTRHFSATIDQPYFKIIPEKTGLKISPLYRFGYEDDSKLRLKCTARPLLFPL